MRLGQVVRPGANVENHTNKILTDLHEKKRTALALNRQPMTSNMNGYAKADSDDARPGLFTTTNASARKMLAYKNKVIKGIINRRIQNVIEINKNDYGLYDKNQAIERIA